MTMDIPEQIYFDRTSRLQLDQCHWIEEFWGLNLVYYYILSISLWHATTLVNFIPQTLAEPKNDNKQGRFDRIDGNY